MPEHNEAWALISKIAKDRPLTPQEAAMTSPGATAARTSEALIAICQALADLRNYKADA